MVNFLNIVLRVALLTVLIVIIVKQVKNIIFDILERKKSKEVIVQNDGCTDSSSDN